jgi:transposase
MKKKKGSEAVKQVVEEVKEAKQERGLSFYEASELFGVGEKTIKLWAEHGKLEARKGLIMPDSIKSFSLLGYKLKAKGKIR